MASTQKVKIRGVSAFHYEYMNSARCSGSLECKEKPVIVYVTRGGDISSIRCKTHRLGHRFIGDNKLTIFCFQFAAKELGIKRREA